MAGPPKYTSPCLSMPSSSPRGPSLEAVHPVLSPRHIGNLVPKTNQIPPSSEIMGENFNSYLLFLIWYLASYQALALCLGKSELVKSSPFLSRVLLEHTHKTKLQETLCYPFLDCLLGGFSAEGLWPPVLSVWAAITKIPQAGWLRNSRHLLWTILEAGSLR